MKTSTIVGKLNLAKTSRKKLLAVLVDPDKADFAHLQKLTELAQNRIACFLVGGSLLTKGSTWQTVDDLKKLSSLPIVLFPGSPSQICENADAILFLSLISGRNPETLINQQVLAAPILKKSQLEVVSTAYMLVDSGRQTTAAYISNSSPIPSDKPGIAVSTAIAGELLGFKVVYMDAGSGAQHPISEKMIKEVSNNIDIPLIIGGGINTSEKIKTAIHSGADMIVIGNAIEDNPSFMMEALEIVESFNA